MAEFFESLLDIVMEGLRFLIEYAFYPKDGETFSLMRIASLFIAFSISGAIALFMSKGAVVKHFGPGANKLKAYLVASVSGTILAVCSCSVLPMFASIRKKGAGLGPAIAFLFSGPAINVLAITLTFTDLGVRIGIIRIVAAVLIALTLGIVMAFIYAKGEKQSSNGTLFKDDTEDSFKPWQKGMFFITLILILVFSVYKPWPTLIFIGLLIIQMVLFLSLADMKAWGGEIWSLAKKIVPLFIVGIFFAGVLQSVLSEAFLSAYVGENTVSANMLASVAGALMYFATLTEIPIIVSLLETGMQRGPAVALLLAGPTLSLPNMIVVGKVLGIKKTLTYVTLVATLAAAVGYLSGLWIL